MDALAHAQFRELERDHWWFRGRRAVYLGLIRQLLGQARVARALDLGSGCGGFAAGLSSLAEHVTSVDRDAQSASACRSRGVAGAVQADGLRLPFAPESFDLVCLFDVLEHLDDDVAALAEVRRVLRPGGILFASVPAWPALYSSNDRVAQHRRRYTRGSLGACVGRAGLEVVRSTHANVLLFPLILPAVLAGKAWEALAGPARAPRTNLSWPLPGALHEILFRAFAAELPLARRFDLPLGHSIALAARRAAA